MLRFSPDLPDPLWPLQAVMPSSCVRLHGVFKSVAVADLLVSCMCLAVWLPSLVHVRLLCLIARRPPSSCQAACKLSRQAPVCDRAQVAFQQADYVAWNLWAAINRRPLLRFQYQHLGDMMSLGRSEGAVALPFGPPAGLADALQRSPLLPLLSAAGIR